MLKKSFLLFSLLFLFITILKCQTYNIVIKGGHVIDAKNNINGIMDVAVNDGKIALVAKNIDARQGRQVVDAKGKYVTPGLIDMHEHVFAGTEPDHYLSNGLDALPPDGFTFRVGVTTVVDCGGAGWKSFPTFKKNIIDHSYTRVLSFLNIVGEGMRGGAYEQDANDMNSKLSANAARQYKDYIVGFKVAHYEAAEWTPVDRAVEAGKLADIPVIVDFGGDDTHPPLSIEDLFFKHLRPGDIYTHTFTELDRRDPIVDLKSRQLKPFVKDAQKKGIIFDVGYGGGSFDFRQALPAIKAGFFPNTMSTDLHTGSMNAAMKDMLNVMSTFVAMGMDVPAVIKAGTWAPAQAIKHEELGNLSVGAVADIAVLNMRQGDFGLWDRMGYKVNAKQNFECEMTIRGGKIVYDLNGIATPIVLTDAKASGH
ncbi:amidohydrolase/deacetylase family metallohydrolase [Segetibacter koreensis]|uniref:amidohydrolase/deacetylase family metallohydrolase n=1 Tax=Segetibacter koreensis TaxID=398037 RepID=UPI000363B839|nr:amidohydrolase/deacetylase family metallohydrolase [Segetibacter koreensis]